MNRASPLVAVTTTAIVLSLAGLSRAPYTPPGSEAAVLRLSWRMSLATPESCRTRTRAELDALPMHMRTPEVCTPDRATYSLITSIDSMAADTAKPARGGVKRDRPLFVLEERSLAPGRHRIRIGLHRVTESGQEALATLDTVLRFEPGAVHLVTLDPEGRALVVVSPPPR